MTHTSHGPPELACPAGTPGATHCTVCGKRKKLPHRRSAVCQPCGETAFRNNRASMEEETWH